MATPNVCVSKKEQPTIVKFFVGKGFGPAAIHRELLSVCKDNTLSLAAVKSWVRKFKNGRVETTKLPRQVKPGNTVIKPDFIQKVESVLQHDRRMTIRAIAEQVGVSHTTILYILRDHLQLRKKCAQWVPKNLTIEQKQKRLEFARNNLDRYLNEGEAFLERIVTGDETWCFHHEPETKRSSMQWLPKGAPPPKKFRSQTSNLKVMASVFFDCKGVLLTDFLPRGSTINAAGYVSTLKKLKDRIKRKRPGLLSDGVLLLHDNARPHTANVTTQVLGKWRWEVLPHPPYSPDLSPCDFHLFGPLKRALKGRYFESDTEVSEVVKLWLKQQQRELFKQGIFRLVGQWEACIAAGGNYF